MTQIVKDLVTWLQQWFYTEDEVDALIQGAGGLTIDEVYPIGSIYMSMSSTDPSVLFGGTWERIANRFLYASEGGQGVGYTDGEETHTLTISEMPSHSHSLNIREHVNGQGMSTKSTRAVWDYNYRNAINSTTTGGGQAHNNMPPYMIVNMWKRTA